jgi:hypothetical protein
MTSVHEDTGDYIRPAKEWEQDISALTKKITKVVQGYAATDAIGAMAAVVKHIASEARD